MISIRPECYDELAYEECMKYMQHRAKVFMAKPDFWFSKLHIV